MARKQMEARASMPETKEETKDPLLKIKNLFDTLEMTKKEIEKIEGDLEMDEKEREKMLQEKYKIEQHTKQELERLAKREIIPDLGIKSADIGQIMDRASEGSHWVYRLELISYPGKGKKSANIREEELNIIPIIRKDNPFQREDKVLKVILTEATDDIDQDEENIKESLGL